MGPQRISEGLKQGARARHYVRAFLRKADGPSSLQLEIARNERVVVPNGYTYVRAHYRGGGESQVIYRSRSAMQLLFEGVDRPEINPEQDDWFEFERMTAVLLENHLGFTILSRAPRGGDRGIDILATKAEGGQTAIWIVQCKCYTPTKPVGPDKIRELIGTIIDFRREKDQVVRGMLVTSSRFTPEATRLAVSHGITIIDQTSLVDICTAANQLAHRMQLY
jgi:Restriction endonuclease